MFHAKYAMASAITKRRCSARIPRQEYLRCTGNERRGRAAVLCQNHPKIKNKLQTLYDVGLGYVKLGQSSTTLSGGEAQRVKLASELQKKPTGKTVYILDEPTTGLHTDDVNRLIGVLERIVNNGDTVIVIEHNMDVIKCADWIIDLGPEGGDNGGTIVAQGTPEEICKVPASWTGQYFSKSNRVDQEVSEKRKIRE
jgi:excinuclease ABC subunit A